MHSKTNSKHESAIYLNTQPNEAEGGFWEEPRQRFLQAPGKQESEERLKFTSNQSLQSSGVLQKRHQKMNSKGSYGNQSSHGLPQYPFPSSGMKTNQVSQRGGFPEQTALKTRKSSDDVAKDKARSRQQSYL